MSSGRARSRDALTRRRTRSGVVVIASMLALGAPGCSRAPTQDANGAPSSPTTTAVRGTAYGTVAGPPDGTAPVDGGKLVLAIEAEPEGIDPTRYALASSGHFVASAVYDPLVKLDRDGKAVPYLAKAIEGSDGFKTWTIEIRTGVTFHDGSALTAPVVSANLTAHRTSLITSGGFTAVTSVEATDPTHVVVKLSAPMVAFPTLLSGQTGYVISKAILDNPELANKPIGTGPFVFRDHVKDKSWTFTKNPTYWQPGLPHLDALDILPLPDNTERLTKLKNGDVDMINARSPQEILDLRSSEFKRVENANGEEEFITLNTQSPPFDNPLARQAVAYATDSERWRKEISLGVDDRANGPFVKGQPGYLDDNGYPGFDLAKAKQLVARYRAETGHDLEFTFHTQADINVQQESQLLQGLYEEAGMKVTVVPLPQINLITVIAFGGYQMGRFRLFSAANPDADAYFWRSTSISPPPGISLNFPRFASKRVDDAIITALGSTDAKVRDDAYATVNREFATNLPYIWLGRAVWTLAANRRVNGIAEAANGTVETIGAKTWLASIWINR